MTLAVRLWQRQLGALRRCAQESHVGSAIPNTNIYSINPATGAGTLLGEIGVASGGTVAGDAASNQYATTTFDPGLYKVSTSTGAGSLIANGSFGQVAAVVYTNGAMYAFNTAGEIRIVDLTNGSSSLVSQYQVSQLAVVVGAAVIPCPAGGAALIMMGATYVFTRHRPRRSA